MYHLIKFIWVSIDSSRVALLFIHVGVILFGLLYCKSSLYHDSWWIDDLLIRGDLKNQHFSPYSPYFSKIAMHPRNNFESASSGRDLTKMAARPRTGFSSTIAARQRVRASLFIRRPCVQLLLTLFVFLYNLTRRNAALSSALVNYFKVFCLFYL